MSTLASPARPVKAIRPRVKPARRVRLIIAPTATMPGIVRIVVGDEPWTDYHFSRLPSAFGTAFRLVQLIGEHLRYDVLLDGPRSSCECKGFARWGHCKHVDGLQALVNRGRL